MHEKIRIFDFFKYSLEDAFFGINEILDDKTHVEYKNLQLDIGDLDSEKVEEHAQAKRYERLIRSSEDVYVQKCVFYLIDAIQTGISKDRLREIQVEGKLSLPYNSKNLHGLKIDKNNLVSAFEFLPFINGYRLNDYVYQLTPMLDSSNSSYWIAQTISSLVHSNKLNFKIRLDPFIEIHHKIYYPMMYKMTIYGKPLDWERLKTLREDEHGRWMNDDLSNNKITDYVWRPDGSELHFTCEELPSSNEIEYRGSRYFHAILDKKTGITKHCDGAIRIYNADELEYRLKYHVKSSEVRKIGKRVKVFQIDEKIDQGSLVLLVTNYMVWNNDVFNYFNS